MAGTDCVMNVFDDDLSLSNVCCDINVLNLSNENCMYDFIIPDLNSTCVNNGNDNTEILEEFVNETIEELDVSIQNEDKLAENVENTHANLQSISDNYNVNQNADTESTESIANEPENHVEIQNEIRKVRCTYMNNMIISHLNVNSINQKFNEVKDLIVRSKFEVIILSETKIDDSYRDALFEIENYNMYRQDKRSNSGGIMIYVSKLLPSTLSNINICNNDIECISIEINCNDTKLLVMGMYKNPKMNGNAFKAYFEKTCEEVFEKYENVVIIGDLNFNMLQDNLLSQMCPPYNLTNIIKEPTCFKSNNATLIDVMLVNKRRKFIKGFSLDTGISDFHNLIGGVMKQHAPIPPKKTIHFRKLENIDYDQVNQELQMMNIDRNIMENDANDAFNILHTNLIGLLDKHAPKKKKIIRKNDFHCMTKRLKKAILIRNQMRNKFFKHRTDHYLAQYRKHRNTVTLIKREEIKAYFTEKCKGSTKNKDFWKAVKPIFSKTKTKSDNIPLKHNDEIITDCRRVCEIFNEFFSQIGLDIGNPENNNKPVEDIIADYANHPSVTMIKTKINPTPKNANLCNITEQDVHKIISKLSSKKASGYDEIPVKFIKSVSTSLINPLTKLANKCIQENVFPDKMKMANITPLYKKKDKLNKDNYRSVNLLIALSKILEKIISTQIYDHMQSLFHVYLSGFRTRHGCHDILIRLTEDWRQALDNGNTVGAVAIDLSKAFDCMPHGLLIAKMHAYGFNLGVCNLLKSYLVDRKQRVKIGETQSEWTTNIKGVPQGSILGPLLFNVFINDFMFHEFHSKIYNYADDNTLSCIDNNINEIQRKLQLDCKTAMKWFESNNMKANADKFQLMFLNRHNPYLDKILQIDTCEIKASPNITILGVEIDNKLNFESHINEICNKTSKQINALKRMKHFIDRPCKNIIYNSYISSNFNYCPIVWMFTGKMNVDKLEKTNKRALRYVINNDDAEYDDLCNEQKVLNIHKRCIKTVAIQMYKIKQQKVPIYVQEMFSRRESHYDIRDNDLFEIPHYKTVTYGKKSFRYFGAKLWANIPKEIKAKPSLTGFKDALTIWLLNIGNVSNIEFL